MTDTIARLISAQGGYWLVLGLMVFVLALGVVLRGRMRSAKPASHELGETELDDEHKELIAKYLRVLSEADGKVSPDGETLLHHVASRL